MKKLVALTMATAMTLSLAACGGASFQQRSSIHRHDGHGILCRRIHGL